MPGSGRRDWRAWVDTFLFAPVDARAAAWLRIAFALALPLFFRPTGIKVAASPEDLAWIHQYILLTPGYWLAIVVMCVLLAIGRRSRAVSVILLLMLLPIGLPSHARVSRQVILFALLAFSFMRSDAVRVPWHASKQRFAGPSWPVRLLQIQLTLLYGVNAIAKSSSEYLNGEVLMDFSATLPNFRVDFTDGALNLAGAAVPVALTAVASALMEYFLAIGFWIRKWKWAVAGCGVAFHIVLTQVVRIYMLDYAAVFLYLAFLLPLIREDDLDSPGRT